MKTFLNQFICVFFSHSLSTIDLKTSYQWMEWDWGFNFFVKKIFRYIWNWVHSVYFCLDYRKRADNTMFNYSDYTLKTFCCGIDLKTATYAISVAHFIFLNSILYSWQYYTGGKIFWTIIQAIATISLFVGVNKVIMHPCVRWLPFISEQSIAE